MNENLRRLMCLPLGTKGVCRTSDGYYLIRFANEIGYDHFLGKPSKSHPGPGRDQMLATWRKMTPDERLEVIQLAEHPIDGSPILLEADFGVPLTEGV